MSWNYRVIRKTYKKKETLLEEECFNIHEVYYDKEGYIISLTKNPVSVGAESLEGLEWVLSKMKEALDKPVLDYEELEGKWKKENG